VFLSVAIEYVEITARSVDNHVLLIEEFEALQ